MRRFAPLVLVALVLVLACVAKFEARQDRFPNGVASVEAGPDRLLVGVVEFAAPLSFS